MKYNSIFLFIFLFISSEISAQLTANNFFCENEKISAFHDCFTDESYGNALNDSVQPQNIKPFGSGLHIGFGKSFNSNSFGEYYRADEISMSFGLDMFYLRSLISVDVTSNKHELIKDYVGIKTFEEGAGTDIINLTYGYSIIDNKRFRLTPFFGVARIEFSTDSPENIQLTENDHNIHFGISAAYKYRYKQKPTNRSIIKINRYNISSLQAKILLTRVHFYDDFEGYLLNFSIVHTWQTNRIVPKI